MDTETKKAFTELGQKLQEKETNSLKPSQKAYMDKAQVMAIITDNETIQGLYSDFDEHPEPLALTKEIKEYEKVQVNIEYIKQALKAITKQKDTNHITIYVKKNKPICFELLNTKIIIAPIFNEGD